MDDLVEIDSSVSNEATACIMVPTAGEKMKNLKHVLLGAYSQRLWPSTLHANRQLRIAVLDEKGRNEVWLRRKALLLWLHGYSRVGRVVLILLLIVDCWLVLRNSLVISDWLIG